ncbi:MAG: OPT/YSL family transporter [Ignisphaera sp.]|nr:OPT/YSL family transporter [Ignisphaera sp.]
MAEREYHPKIYEPAVLLLGLILAVFGAIIGMELICRVGVNPNTSIIGALIAIAFSMIPVEFARKMRNVHRVNLMQTVISGATFQAGNVFLLTIAVPYLLGVTNPTYIYGVMLGVAIAAVVDVLFAYWIFDSPFFPAKNPWPPGVATAEAIKAALQRGRRALLLLYGMIFGGALTYFGYPGDVVGITLITQIVAITAFGIGLILRAYGPSLFGIDFAKIYAPQGIMVGAGIAALIQFVMLYLKVRKSSAAPKSSTSSDEYRPLIPADEAVRKMVVALILFTVGAVVLGFIAGIHEMLSTPMFIVWILYTGFQAWFTTLLCAISGMYAGWFPAFATALASLVISLLFGWPPLAAGVSVAYVAATGPGMADLNFDLKTGWILSGEGKDPVFEREGRKWQLAAKFLALAVSITLVVIFYRAYFEGLKLFPPASRTLAATAKAAADPQLARWLLTWAPIGFVLQLVGGAERQIGILLATGLMIVNPAAGIAVLATVAARIALVKIFGEERLRDIFYIGGAGAVGGSAIVSFIVYTLRAYLRI